MAEGLKGMKGLGEIMHLGLKEACELFNVRPLPQKSLPHLHGSDCGFACANAPCSNLRKTAR